MSQRRTPAASFTRVDNGRRPPAEPAGAQGMPGEEEGLASAPGAAALPWGTSQRQGSVASTSAPWHAGGDEEGTGGLPDESSWVVGSVVERPVQATSAPTAAGPAPFPAATHRKLSKVLAMGTTSCLGCNATGHDHHCCPQPPSFPAEPLLCPLAQFAFGRQSAALKQQEADAAAAAGAAAAGAHALLAGSGQQNTQAAGRTAASAAAAGAGAFVAGPGVQDAHAAGRTAVSAAVAGADAFLAGTGLQSARAAGSAAAGAAAAGADRLLADTGLQDAQVAGSTAVGAAGGGSQNRQTVASSAEALLPEAERMRAEIDAENQRALAGMSAHQACVALSPGCALLPCSCFAFLTCWPTACMVLQKRSP
jgi:hypothetical protein